jgi:uncharacterized membrane protein YecN with MAPEG domain
MKAFRRSRKFIGFSREQKRRVDIGLCGFSSMESDCSVHVNVNKFWPEILVFYSAHKLTDSIPNT